VHGRGDGRRSSASDFMWGFAGGRRAHPVCCRADSKFVCASRARMPAVTNGPRPVMSWRAPHGSAVGLTFGAWHGVSAVIYVLACVSP